MAGDRHWKISAGLAVAAGMSLLAIPIVRPACDGLVPTAMGGAVPMRCHFSYRVELLLAVACVLVALTLFLLTGREARRLGGFFLLILGILAAVVPQPWVIGTCGGGTCHTGGTWFETVGVFLAVAGLLTGAGVAIGLLLGGVLGLLVHAWLQGQRAFPFIEASWSKTALAIVVTGAAFGLVALVAAWWPARQSGRIAPSSAMAMGDID